ncbi:hypothetical protein [Streptomyces albipurpureus]|uniref:Uncharacterized protein n=1 Tax=Streptomyces albipurpureus TaxID=2897419 RepID=A0ABT0UPA9_9ACTN|nr:hypothetical protein [Streptomyces sp. CWNU-1]MCM2390182.1 hypothetical protein [Streptomyces sp. CWNU-1]
MCRTRVGSISVEETDCLYFLDGQAAELVDERRWCFGCGCEGREILTATQGHHHP